MKTVLIGVLILLSAGLLITGKVHAQQEIDLETRNEAKTVVHPGPQDIVEKVGIYVFLAWVWISIVVLIYFLRLKVKEADRLYELKYYDSFKKESDQQK